MHSVERTDFSRPAAQENFYALSKELREKIIDDAREEAMGMLLAETLHMEYQPGGVTYETGVKGDRVSDDGGGERVDGRRVVKGGYGSFIYVTPSRFKLWVSLPKSGEKLDVWTERDFRTQIDTKRLTERIRKAIEMAKPRYVALIKQESKRGTTYYRVDPDVLKDWAERAKGYFKEASAEVKKEKAEMRAEFAELSRQIDENLHKIANKNASERPKQEIKTREEIDKAQLREQILRKYRR